MFAGYLFCFYLEFTGVIGHQWLGVGIGVLAVLHTWLHWDWVAVVTKRFFKCTGVRNRWYYGVDLLILLGFVIILETGLVISTWLNLDLLNYVVWLDIHTYASYATLALLVIKVGVHWRWVVNTTGRIFGTLNKPILNGGLKPVLLSIKTNKSAMDRRRFLGLMGVVGAGSLLAVINVVCENSFFNSTGNDNVSAMGFGDAMSTETATAESATPIATMETPALTAESNAASTPDIISTMTAEPTATSTQVVVVACQVRCPKGCSFPGRCRRYTDQNGNRLCDLGECL